MSVKTAADLKAMREGGRRLSGVLEHLVGETKAGLTTKQIAELARVELLKQQLQPILVGYQGYQEVMCISLNDEVVHGVPSVKRVIKAGDLVKLDLTAAYQGLIVDAATSVFMGDQPSAEVKRLLAGAQQALEAGIDAIKGEGTRVGNVAAAIQGVLEKHDLGIVRDLVGHGVGHGVHEDPNIPNYGMAGTGPALRAGETIAVEPMATLGGWQVDILKDGWTVATRDHSLSAHFEHTVLVTDRGAEILTISEDVPLK